MQAFHKGRGGPGNEAMMYLKGSEPHEPVEAVVVGGYGAGTTASGAWFALELNLLPYSHFSILPQGGVVGTF